MTKFSDLKLAPQVATALEKIGYDEPTPIQAKAIPPILEGKDIQGIAQTGTGKTAAFTLPVLSRLADDPKEAPKRSMRVLILSPTRELARQIGESVTSYSRHIDNFKSTVIFGGVKLPRQIKRVVPGNDIVVATPGRLLDLMDQKIINLKSVEYLVLDEADQMMDMGFIHALRKMIPHLPKERQTLFFSATMPKSIEKLAGQFLTNPVKVAISPESTTAERVEQSIIFANRVDKQNLLCMKLLDPAINRALVFTRTKHGADRLVKRLATVGLKSVAIHGNKNQNQRTRALAAFKEGEVKLLIATDVAARGIDIRGVSHVFNYEIPNVPEQYVHRIGRTGRAGEAGIAISFVGDDEKDYLRDIQKILKMKIPVEPMPDDFAAQIKMLKARPALSKEDMPGGPPPNARKQKGRKSRPAFGEGRKAKASKHRKGPTAQPKDGNADTEPRAAAPHPPRNRPKKDASGKPSRAQRKRDGAAARGEGKNGQNKHKPRRASGEAVDAGTSLNRTGKHNGGKGRKPQRSAKPYRGDKPRSDHNGSRRDGANSRSETRSHSEARNKSQNNKSQGENRARHAQKPRTNGGESGGAGQGGFSSPKRRSAGKSGGGRNQPPANRGSASGKNKFARKPRNKPRAST